MSANDLADALAVRLEHRATQNRIVRSYGITPSSRPEDDDMDREAAALLREQAEQLDTFRNAESVGVSYCTLHHGIANEDDSRCDFADNPRPCVLVDLIQRPRPALAAAGGGVPEEGATDE